MSIKKQKFICIDCESTGLDPKQDRVIEVALLLFDGEQIYREFETLVDPECEIPASSIEIHHITQDMVQGKPKIHEVLPELLEIVGKHILVGHGIRYDMEILQTEAERHSVPSQIIQNRYIDTLRMARLYGESPVNSLEYLRKHFNIPQEGAHRAMNDVIVNKDVFYALAKDYKSVENLFDVLSKPILMNHMPLGKHKGRAFKEIPLQYLQWMSNKEFDNDLLYSIRTELKKRKKGNSFNQSTNPFHDL